MQCRVCELHNVLNYFPHLTLSDKLCNATYYSVYFPGPPPPPTPPHPSIIKPIQRGESPHMNTKAGNLKCLPGAHWGDQTIGCTWQLDFLFFVKKYIFSCSLSHSKAPYALRLKAKVHEKWHPLTFKDYNTPPQASKKLGPTQPKILLKLYCCLIRSWKKILKDCCVLFFPALLHTYVKKKF